MKQRTFRFEKAVSRQQKIYIMKKPTSITFNEDQKENILFKIVNDVLFIHCNRRLLQCLRTGCKQFHFALLLMICLIAERII